MGKVLIHIESGMPVKVGDKVITNNGYDVEIIKFYYIQTHWAHWDTITVRFDNGRCNTLPASDINAVWVGDEYIKGVDLPNPVCYISEAQLAWLKSRPVDDSNACVRYGNGFPNWVPQEIRDKYLGLYATDQMRARYAAPDAKVTAALKAAWNSFHYAEMYPPSGSPAEKVVRAAKEQVHRVLAAAPSTQPQGGNING